LITDIVMPGMNGPALAEHLCHMHPGLNVVFLSGYAEAAISGRGLFAQRREFSAEAVCLESACKDNPRHHR
jgi:DNA-binding LytR/AlgR family response regulator